ncbi:MAG TPA: DUF4188 domain-containing protein [Terriglobales bacterium]|nr:DUF4188 domain-containing protein [Terriglobales bacterium]
MHAGMRQYWRDFESLERRSRLEPHMLWWKEFLRNSGGTGFWHETYFMRGGIEAIYDDMPVPTGLAVFAPARVARGPPMFSARARLRRWSGNQARSHPRKRVVFRFLRKRALERRSGRMAT